MLKLEIGDEIEIHIRAIENGYIIRSVKKSDNVGIWSEWTYHRLLNDVSGALASVMFNTIDLTPETGRADF